MEDLKRLKILVVDDSPDSAKMMKLVLSADGYENIQIASSGAEALEIINHFPPDLILLDIVMPEMNGFELCRTTKADSSTRNIPVIMVSGSFRDSDEALKQAFDAGAMDFIPKPIRRPEILARVKSALSLKWANDSVRQELAKQNYMNERLQTALNFIDNIIETSLNAIVITNTTGYITRVNEAYLEMVDYTREEVVGKHMFEMAPGKTGWFETVSGEKFEFTEAHQDKAKKMIEILLEKGRVPEFEGFALRKDGKLVLTLEDNVIIYNERKEKVGAASIIRDISQIKKTEKEKETLIAELKQTLEQVKKLEGLIPICSSCKKIRDDRGYWNQIETYIRDHSEAEFSHSLCPDCAKKFYPELAEEIDRYQK